MSAASETRPTAGLTSRILSNDAPALFLMLGAGLCWVLIGVSAMFVHFRPEMGVGDSYTTSEETAQEATSAVCLFLALSPIVTVLAVMRVRQVRRVLCQGDLTTGLVVVAGSLMDDLAWLSCRYQIDGVSLYGNGLYILNRRTRPTEVGQLVELIVDPNRRKRVFVKDWYFDRKEPDPNVRKFVGS